MQDDQPHDGKILPRDAIIRYREWYGAKAPNEGLKIPAEIVAKGIRDREDTEERIAYGVLDPAAFAVISGPSIAETMSKHGVYFRRADNSRLSVPKRMGGWDQLRARLRGNDDGQSMIFFFEDCHAILRTLPMMQHSEINPEDLDTEAEDHAVDEVRYACMSRPFRQRLTSSEADDNPFLVANAFKLRDLD